IKTTEMSFAVRHSPSQLEYCGSGLNGLFRQRRNLVNLGFIRMLLAIDRFNDEALEILNNPKYDQWTISDLVEARSYGDDFFYKYLIPMSSAVWSTPPDKMRVFPAKTLLRFFYNHGFLGLHTQHQWYTVEGGSESYKQRLIAPFKDKIRLQQNIRSVDILENGKVEITHQSGETEVFDKIIFACHADEALALLANPSLQQRRLLSSFSYQANEVILHSDAQVMPKHPGVWSAWNYRIEIDAENQVRPTTIYWMNRLQGVSKKTNYFVSLNEPGAIDPSQIHQRIQYHHPLFDAHAIDAQKELHLLNEDGSPFYFCGSYFRYGFHEDAFKSAVELSRILLGKEPW
ncbi:MAG: FAD-dependent oxidoreductase, partial [Proteobacteria bacterium]|nr:FAD-dependent oxidoreductase [Pseudomonadota bacterium]